MAIRKYFIMEKDLTSSNKLPSENDGVEKTSNNIDFPKEEGGPKGPEPTRYGDWEKSGRCSDF